MIINALANAAAATVGATRLKLNPSVNVEDVLGGLRAKKSPSDGCVYIRVGDLRGNQTRNILINAPNGVAEAVRDAELIFPGEVKIPLSSLRWTGSMASSENQRVLEQLARATFVAQMPGLRLFLYFFFQLYFEIDMNLIINE